MIKPLGFEIDDKRVKRAGLDYWQFVDLHLYESIQDFLKMHKDRNLAFMSSHGRLPYTEIPTEDEVFLVFGKESSGLGSELRERFRDQLFKIPIMSKHVRSLNLANAVSIVAYDCLRKMGL